MLRIDAASALRRMIVTAGGVPWDNTAVQSANHHSRHSGPPSESPTTNEFSPFMFTIAV
jgi:hypothetical protein